MLARGTLRALRPHSWIPAMRRYNSDSGSAAASDTASTVPKAQDETTKSSWAARATSNEQQQGVGDYSAIMRAVYISSDKKKNTIPVNMWPRIDDNQRTYDPSIFTFESATGRSRRGNGPERIDKFAANKINPLSLWKDPAGLSQYVTTNGKIIPGYLHGTRGKNNKRLAKAIRRARAAGLMSTVHRSVDQL